MSPQRKRIAIKKRRSRSVGEIAFKEFNLLTEIRGAIKS